MTSPYMYRSQRNSAGLMAMLLVLFAGTMAQAAAAPGGVDVSYTLPTDGPLPQTYRVTLAIVDPKRPAWIISQFVCGQTVTVTAENQGKFTANWDGLDENFMPIPPGEYGVKGIFMPAKRWDSDGQYHTLVAKVNGSPFCWMPRPDEDQLPPIVQGDPVDSAVGDVATADNGHAVMYWDYFENGKNDYVFDLNKPIGLSQLITGYPSGGAAGGEWTTTDGTSVWSYCENGDIPFLFRADQKPFGRGKARYRNNVFLTDGAPGGLACWHEQASGKSFVYFAETGRWKFETIPNHRYPHQVEDVHDRLDRVRIFDGDNGAVLGQILLPQPVALTRQGERLFALHGTAGHYVVSWIALKKGMPSGDWQLRCALPATMAPTDLAVDSHDRMYVSDPPSNHVYQIGPSGEIAVTIGKLAGQIAGSYDPNSFMFPRRVAVWTDAHGEDRILVVEDQGPARVSEWTPDGKLLREWGTLLPGCNGGYAFDSEAPNDVYICGNGNWLIRYKVDFATGHWTCSAVWPDISAGMKTGWAPHGLAYPTIVHTQGHKYITFNRGYAVYRFDGDRLLESAAIIRRGSANTAKEFLWHDANGDGQIQDNEVDPQPLARPAAIYSYFGEDWQQDLSLIACGGGGRDIWRLAPEGFDDHGNPIFKQWTRLLTDPVMQAKADGTADSLHGGDELTDVFNESWRSVVGTPAQGYFTDVRSGTFSANFSKEQKISRYLPDGKGGYDLLWRIGRCNNIKPGPGGIAGSIEVSDPAYNLVAVTDQSTAGMLIFTADQGLYVDTLFLDGSQQQRSIYGSPGEYFYGKTFLNKSDGNVYVCWGKHTPMLFSVPDWKDGLKIRSIENLDKVVSISSAQIADAPEAAIKVRGGPGKAIIAEFSPATGIAPNLDGSLTGWEGCSPIIYGDDTHHVEARCAYDAKNIYVRWHVQGSEAVQIKPLEPADRLFTHDRGADTVGLYLQTDPSAAAPSSSDGRAGDVRLIFGLFAGSDGKVVPSVLGMYPSYKGKGTPITYGTIVGKASFAHVGLLPDAKLAYTLDEDRKGFILAAAIPQADLPAAIPVTGAGIRTRANFDANFGGNHKLWWSNADGSASRETNDEPTEARLYDRAWAPAAFDGMGDGFSVRDWQVIGPFGVSVLNQASEVQDRGTLLQRAKDATFPPEKSVDLSASYDDDSGPAPGSRHGIHWVRWSGNEAMVPLSSTLAMGGNRQAGSFYLATWVHSPEKASVRLHASDAGHSLHCVRGWINGQPLPTTKPGVAQQKFQDELDDSQSVTLSAGWNQVVLRLDNVYGTAEVGLRLDASPEVLWTLAVRATPPGAADRPNTMGN